MCVFIDLLPWRGTSVFRSQARPSFFHESKRSVSFIFHQGSTLCCCIVPKTPPFLSEVSIVAVCSEDGLVLCYHDCEHFWSRDRPVMAGEWLLWTDREEIPSLLPAGSVLQGFLINCHFCPVVFLYFSCCGRQRQFYKVLCPAILQLLQATLERNLS